MRGVRAHIHRELAAWELLLYCKWYMGNSKHWVIKSILSSAINQANSLVIANRTSVCPLHMCVDCILPYQADMLKEPPLDQAPTIQQSTRITEVFLNMFSLTYEHFVSFYSTIINFNSKQISLIGFFVIGLTSNALSCPKGVHGDGIYVLKLLLTQYYHCCWAMGHVNTAL